MGGRGASSFERGINRRMLDIRKINGAEYEKTINGDQVTIYAKNYEDSQRIERQLIGNNTNNNLTQDILDNSPVVLKTGFGESSTYYVFKDIKTMNNKIRKEYGGFNQLGKLNQDYFIKSAIGKGNYYLNKNRLYKNGQFWSDENGEIVKGYQYKKIK